MRELIKIQQFATCIIYEQLEKKEEKNIIYEKVEEIYKYNKKMNLMCN